MRLFWYGGRGFSPSRPPDCSARQVEKVAEYYKDKFDDISEWEGAANEAERIVKEARKAPETRPPSDGGVSLVLGEKDVGQLGVTDRDMTEEERKRFLKTIGSNVKYRLGAEEEPDGDDTSVIYSYRRPRGEKTVDEVEFSGEEAGETFDLLQEVARNRGRTVNISMESNSAISPEDIKAVGGKVTKSASGYYVILDRAQWDVLNDMRPPVASEPASVEWDEFFVGNSFRMPNREPVQLARSYERSNTLIVSDKKIRLNTNQLLLVANDKGISVVRAGQAVKWGVARREERVTEQGFTLDVPRAGRVHLFEKLLMKAGERPEILIQYEGKGGLL